MTASGRSRNAPCFCGSGRKLKHCCARQLTVVRTWKSPRGNCRWRFWKAHTPTAQFASELAEHVCSGERLWIARDTAAGTSWMIDDELASLFQILDRLPGVHYHWVIEQTMAALGEAVPARDGTADPTTDELPEQITILSEMRDLTFEIMRLAHAGDALQTHVPTSFTPSPEPKLHHQLWKQLAA